MNKTRSPRKVTGRKLIALKMANISQLDVKTASNLTCQGWRLVTLNWNIKKKVASLRLNKYKQISSSEPEFSQIEIQGICQFWWLTGGMCRLERSSDTLFTKIKHFEFWGLEIYTRNVFWGHLIHFSQCLTFKPLLCETFPFRAVLFIFRLMFKNFARITTRNSTSIRQDVSRRILSERWH